MPCAVPSRNGSRKRRKRGKANRELVTAMSHDRALPLTSLLGYVDILQMEKEDRGAAEKVSEFHSG